MAAFQLTKPKKNSACRHLWEKWCWNYSGIIKAQFQGKYTSKGTIITSASYCILLRNHPRPAIRSKFCHLVSTDVLLLHDSARPYTACVTAETISDIHFECLPQPMYSSGYAPCDYHIFGSFKEASGGKTFQSNEEVWEAVHEWLCMQPWGFWVLV